MENVIDVIKSYNDYSYDDILDAYSKFKTEDLIDYCFIKNNKLELPDVMKYQNKSYEDALIYLFNIQRKIEGKYTIVTLDAIQEILNPSSINNDDDWFNETF